MKDLKISIRNTLCRKTENENVEKQKMNFRTAGNMKTAPETVLLFDPRRGKDQPISM